MPFLTGLQNVTVWRVQLSDKEIRAIARGRDPATVRPDAIVFRQGGA